ncbi:MAG: hypothetical protein PHH14_00760 [Candidatus Margulisbacteria bacterium]|nr:hypothetical protein [Candidatus Margulisiibacteriota bacterium]
MKDIHGVGAFGYLPYLSEDLIKQTRLANIKTRAGKIAYIMSLGENAKKPQVKEGIYEARGALKWIKEEMDNEE